MIQFRLVVDNPTADSEQMTVVQPDNSPRQPEVLNVQKAVLLDSSDVKNATASVDPLGQPIIEIKLTADGAKRFADVTGKNVGERLAIVIDGKLYEAPRINTAITGGEAQISGHFTKEEAKNLAARLNGSNGSPSGQVRPGNKTVFFALAAMVVVALVTAAWVALRQRRAPPAA
jgi:preprotein translocase subunit SecD